MDCQFVFMNFWVSINVTVGASPIWWEISSYPRTLVSTSTISLTYLIPNRCTKLHKFSWIFKAVDNWDQFRTIQYCYGSKIEKMLVKFRFGMVASLVLLEYFIRWLMNWIWTSDIFLFSSNNSVLKIKFQLKM